MILRHIPNLFTLTNLFCGCMAIVFVLHPTNSFIEQDGWINIYHLRWMLAPFWIFAAAVIDFLDGFVARWLKAESPLGGQLDSLSDVVSFGVAPGMILFQLLQFAILREPHAINTTEWLLVPAFLIPIASAWRLAVFNLDTEQRSSFRGVPTPLTAMVVASLPLILWFHSGVAEGWILNKWTLYALIILLSAMMVSRFPLMSLKVKSWKGKDAAPQMILLLSSLGLLIFLQWLALPLIYVLFLVLSLIFRKQIL